MNSKLGSLCSRRGRGMAMPNNKSEFLFPVQPKDDEIQPTLNPEIYRG